MSLIGAKVSKKNFNILNTTDPRNMVISSELPGLHIFKIIRENLKYIAGAGSAVRTLNIAHGYTKGIPAFMAFYSKNGFNHPIQHREQIDAQIFQFDAWANSTEIVCAVFNNAANANDQYFDFTVYIFAEKLG